MAKFKQSLMSRIKNKLTGKRHWYMVNGTFLWKSGNQTAGLPGSTNSTITVGVVDQRQSVDDWRSFRKALALRGIVPSDKKYRHLIKDGKIIINSLSYLGYFK